MRAAEGRAHVLYPPPLHANTISDTLGEIVLSSMKQKARCPMLKISKTDEINARLRREGKVMTLDKPEHLAAIAVMNKNMEAARREYLVKSGKSSISAGKVLLPTSPFRMGGGGIRTV
jgi:hypothetical protein